MRSLRDNGYTLTGLRIATVLFGEFLKVQQRITRPARSRSAKGVVNGGILTRDEVVAELEEETRKKHAAEAAKTGRKAAIEAKIFADAQGGAERRSALGRGTSRDQGGRGRGTGRGGGRGSS